jgi:hypothetical protein
MGYLLIRASEPSSVAIDKMSPAILVPSGKLLNGSVMAFLGQSLGFGAGHG